MVDIHCHILPGVDDGARNFSETETMLRIAYKEGIRTIFATPHTSEGMTEEEWQRRKEIFARTRQLAGMIGEDFRIVLGAEILYTSGIIRELKDGRIRTMNGSPFVLIEFPLYVDFSYIRQAVQDLKGAGYRPMLAHVERYPALADVENIGYLIEMGAYIQVNASSVTGKSGWKVKRYIKRLLKNEYIHFIGTDAHGKQHRRPLMKECAAYIEKKAGRQYRNRVCGGNAKEIIRRKTIDVQH